MKKHRSLILILILIVLLLALKLIFWPELLRNSLATELFKGKNYKKAAELFAKNGSDSIAKANTGKALYKEGHPAEAAAAIDEALATAKDKAELYYDRGNAAFAERDYEAALQNYTESLLLNPQDQDAKANLELTLRKLKENPPPARSDKDEKAEQERSTEEVRKILEALDNKEAQDRKEQNPQAPHRTDNWW